MYMYILFFVWLTSHHLMQDPGKISPVEADDPKMAKVIEPGLIGIMKIVKANGYPLVN